MSKRMGIAAMKCHFEILELDKGAWYIYHRASGKMLRVKNKKPYFTREANYTLVLRNSKEMAESLLDTILNNYGELIKKQVATP